LTLYSRFAPTRTAAGRELGLPTAPILKSMQRLDIEAICSQINPPTDDRSQDDGGAEVSGEFVVTGCHSTPVLEV